jgi:hypothetical protein
MPQHGYLFECIQSAKNNGDNPILISLLSRQDSGILTTKRIFIAGSGTRPVAYDKTARARMQHYSATR